MSGDGSGSDEDPRRNASEAAGKKAAGKKAAGKKTAGKKTAGKKTTGKKTAGKKTAGKKTAGKKTAGKKTTGKKTTGKKTTGKKTTGKKTTGKKTTGKKTTGKKTTGKKATGKKATGKKTTGKKATGKKATAAKGGPRAASSGASAVGGLPEPGSVGRPWLASYPAGVPESYEYPLVPLTRLLDDAAADFPQATAVEFLGATWSYRRVREDVERFATALGSLDVQRGDRVSVLLPNCPQHVVTLFAVLRLGAVVVEHDVFGDADRLRRELSDAAPKVLVCLDSLYGGLEDRVTDLPGPEQVVVTGLREMMPFSRRAASALRPGTGFGMAPSTAGGSAVGRAVPKVVRPGRAAGPSGTAGKPQRFSELLTQTPAMVGQAEVAPGEDPAFVLYPADGDGRNGVTLTHSQVVTNAVQIRLWLRDVRAGGEKVLCAVPFSRSYGLTAGLATAVLTAASLTLLPRFEAGLALATVARRRVTLLPGTPGMYAALSQEPRVRRGDLTSLRACLSATTPLAADVAEAIERRTACPVLPAWAPGEAFPLTHAQPVDGRRKPGSVGLPLPDTVCAVADTATSSSASGEAVGRLAVAGPQLATGGARDGDGWVLTDEEAEIDEDGYVVLASRR